jgi:S-layer protein
MATTVESIQQLYIAYFNRPADAGGLAFWVDSVNKGVTLNSVAAQFAAQPEYKAVFANMSNDQIVARVYQNLFNRLPELGGLNYWSNLLKTGAITVDRIVTEVAASAQQDPAKGPDTISIQSKVAAAVAFTDYLNTDVAARVAYSSGGVNSVGINYLAGVSDVASLGVAKTGLPTTTATAIITGNVAGGTTYALTLNPDTVVGTTGNDTFNASWDAANTTKTLTDLDSIDGGTGTDTLNVIQIGAIDTTGVSATVKNIENVNLTATADITADTTAWTGVTALTANAVNNVVLTAAATTNIVANISKAAGATTIAGGNNVTVTATGAVGGSIEIGDATAVTGPAGAVVVTTTASGTAVTSDSITVTGGTSVAITSNLKSTTVAADITGGDIAVNGTAATTVVSVTQTAAVANGAKVAGIVDGKVTIIDANSTEATKAGSISTVSLTNYGTGSSIDSNALTNLTLSGTGGTLDLNDQQTNPTVTTLNLTVNGLKGAAITDVSTKNHFTTLNVTTTGKDSTIANFTDTVTTALNVTGDHAVTFTSASGLSALKTVTVSGAAGLDIDVSALTKVASVDASASTGTNTVTVLADQTSYAGGSGVDTVTITKDATKAIDGGAGTADELVLNSVAADFTSISGNDNISDFEILGLGAATKGAYDASGFSALHIGADVAGDVSFINVAAGAALSIDDAITANVEYTLKANTSNDAVVLNVGNVDADGLDFTNAGAVSITLTDIENVTLNSIGSNEDGTGTNFNTVDITDAKATSLTITGTEGVTLTGFAGSTLKTIDATAMGADMTVDLHTVTLAAAGVTFKGGDANFLFEDSNLAAGKALVFTAGNGDNIVVDSSATTGTATVTLGNGDNIVDLGATLGVNKVVVGTGINQITLGTGASIVTVAADTNTSDDIDTITVGTPATANNYATITGLGKGDVLSFADHGAEVWSGGVGSTGATAKIVLDTSTALFADYVAAASAGDGSTNGVFSWFQFGGNTYVVEDKSADAGFVANADIIVKLTGAVDLTKATVGDHIITLA